MLEKRIAKNESITPEDVEVATFDTRRELNEKGYDIKTWKKDSSINVCKSSDELLRQSMAYAKTPIQAAPILQAKQEQMEKTPRNSIKNIIEPLKDLQEAVQHEKPKNLFAAVLAIHQDNIDVRKKRCSCFLDT
jgi:hypothetical protein